MATFSVVRGDGSDVTNPILKFTIANVPSTTPMDLTSCTVRTTFKTAPVNPNTDTTDATAYIKGTLVVSGAGAATTQDRLYMVGAASAGVVALVLSPADTLALPLGTPLSFDIEVTKSGIPRTYLPTDTLVAKEGYTNRTTG